MSEMKICIPVAGHALSDLEAYEEISEELCA
jgi:hypothetical protein